MRPIKSLIIDIHTIADDWTSFDEASKHQLTEWIPRKESNQDKHGFYEDLVKESLHLSPFTASIASLAIFDPLKGEGCLYIISSSDIDESYQSEVIKIKTGAEAEALTWFYSGADTYQAYVGLFMRQFCLPFLVHRALKYNIEPIRGLGRTRYLHKQTPPYLVDLSDELSFYGALSRRIQPALLARTYGIPDLAITNSEVTEAYLAEDWDAYCDFRSRQIFATTQLYDLWRTSLAPKPFSI